MIRRWHPRNILQRTNWLHYIVTLCVHDSREINIIWEVAFICIEQYNQFTVCAYVIKSVIDTYKDFLYQQTWIRYSMQLLTSFSLCVLNAVVVILMFVNSILTDTSCPNNFTDHFNMYIHALLNIDAPEMIWLSLEQQNRFIVICVFLMNYITIGDIRSHGRSVFPSIWFSIELARQNWGWAGIILVVIHVDLYIQSE